MRSEVCKAFLGLALVASCFGVARPARADEVLQDLGQVNTRIDELTQIEYDNQVRLDNLYESTSTMRGDISQLVEVQSQMLEELKGMRADADYDRPTDEEKATLSSIDASLKAMSEPEPESESEVEIVPYMTLDGIGQLLMINTGCLAVIIGSKAFELLWSAIAGAR